MGYCTQEQAAAILDAMKCDQKARMEEMPDEERALAEMHRAYIRLTEMGWRNAIYCPKDGTIFEAIEAGSTGIFDCYYDGEWPDGRWWILGNGDLWPSRPILFRLKQAKQ